MSGGSEEAIRNQWWWCSRVRDVLDDIERGLTADLQSMSDSIWFDDDLIESLSTVAEDMRTHVDGEARFASRLRVIEQLLADIVQLARAPVDSAQITSIRSRVREIRDSHDWLGDWTQEEWMLVHYWSKLEEKGNA